MLTTTGRSFHGLLRGMLYVLITASFPLTPAFAARDFNVRNDSRSFLFVSGTSGNVGIGTAGPVGRLHVVAVGTTTGIAFQIDNSLYQARMTVLDNGNIGIGTTSPAARMEALGQYFSRRYTATLSVDWFNGNAQMVQLTNGANAITFTSAQPGGRYLLEIKQPASGAAGTVTWDANVRWSGSVPPTLTATNSQTDLVTLYYNGTNFMAVASLDYAP